ncbi:MAG: amino acid racemase [Spirochaetales bacterium]|nr:amino acid racemase [Spirochaetales bacterium]
MKKIGLIGGLGPEATLLYYKGILNSFSASFSESGYPEMIIESLDLKGFTDYAKAGEWDAITNQLISTCGRLQAAGADFGAICSNTPHRVFNRLQKNTSLPLISIVETAAEAAADRGLKRLGLLGTGFTMAGTFYQEVFGKHHIDIVMPGTEEKNYIHEKIFTEIEFGIIKEETKQRFLDIIRRMTAEQAIEGILLACTELPLIVTPSDLRIAYLDTTALHIRAIVRETRTG